MAGLVRDRYERVRVVGAEARSFLDGLLSQDLAEVETGGAVRSFLLSPQGKLRALLWVAGSDEAVDLYTDAGYGAQVADDLAHYKIRVKATIEDAEGAFGFLDDIPPDAAIAPLGERRRGFGVSDPGWDELAPAEWEAARVEAGEPVMGRDVDESTIPQETGLVSEAVSFTKGCFLGQELVARLDSRQGRVNRHLRRVELSGPVTVPATVSAGGEPSGQLTSIGVTPDRIFGLGLLHRRVEPGDTVTVGDLTARVL